MSALTVQRYHTNHNRGGRVYFRELAEKKQGRRSRGEEAGEKKQGRRIQ
jgi:hypothetical protein